MSFIRRDVVTRMPSLYFLHALLRMQRQDVTSLLNQGVDPRNAFYVLNPENNLPQTQQKFAAMFKTYVKLCCVTSHDISYCLPICTHVEAFDMRCRQEGWTGLTGEIPTAEQYTNGLAKHDLFVYVTCFVCDLFVLVTCFVCDFTSAQLMI